LEQKENRRSAFKVNNGKILKERHAYQVGTMKELSVKQASEN